MLTKNYILKQEKYVLIGFLLSLSISVVYGVNSICNSIELIIKISYSSLNFVLEKQLKYRKQKEDLKNS